MYSTLKAAALLAATTHAVTTAYATTPQEIELQDAKDRYAKTVALATNEANTRYISKLNALLKEKIQKEDLDGALIVREAIRQAQAESPLTLSAGKAEPTSITAKRKFIENKAWDFKGTAQSVRFRTRKLGEVEQIQYQIQPVFSKWEILNADELSFTSAINTLNKRVFKMNSEWTRGTQIDNQDCTISLTDTTPPSHESQGIAGLANIISNITDAKLKCLLSNVLNEKSALINSYGGVLAVVKGQLFFFRPESIGKTEAIKINATASGPDIVLTGTRASGVMKLSLSSGETIQVQHTGFQQPVFYNPLPYSEVQRRMDEIPKN